jgi:hypothetical protein
VSKLGEAEAPGFPVPASASGEFVQGGATAGSVSYTCSKATVNLDYQGQEEFPPMRATFTGFGFEPVTATAYLVQDGSAPLTSVGYLTGGTIYTGGPGAPIGTVATASVELRLADVTVNGTSLDVGSDCRTSGPLTSQESPVDQDMLVLAGGNQPGDPVPFNNLLYGGELEGEADIPAFTGCVTPSGENVDALLDATVSGPDNYVRMNQGPACISTQASTYCSGGGTEVALPGPLWTVTGGGSYTGTAPLTLNDIPVNDGVLITCASSSVAGTVPDTDGPPRGLQMTFGWTSASGCTGILDGGTVKKPTSTPYGTWTVTMTGTPSPALYTYTAGTETSAGVIWNVTLELDGTDLPATPSSCRLQLSGGMYLSYSNSSSELSIGEIAGNSGSLSVASSDCTSTYLTTGNGITPIAAYTLTRPIQITSP